MGSATTSPPLSLRFGKYELIRQLAVGGMAEIFVARVQGIESFERLVVLKRILPALAGDGRFIRMFLNEARLSARLHHSNIAQVFDLGKVGPTYYFTMEYVHGVDLPALQAAVKARGERVPLEHCLSIILGASAGLHYAHEQRGSDRQPLGLVHRDVSPRNVLVGYDGCVKLVDFGIAKAAHVLTETQPGAITGTLCYLSPEQAVRQPVDRRSDVFGLGILLYELTTGQLLFEGENDFEVLNSITTVPIAPPSTRVPGYPLALERIVMRALERRPETRYPTAQALQDDLMQFAQQQALACHPHALSKYLEDIFADEVSAWRTAQGDSESMADYLARRAQFERVGTEPLEAPSLPALPKAPASPGPSPSRVRNRRLRLLARVAGVGTGLVVLVLLWLVLHQR